MRVFALSGAGPVRGWAAVIVDMPAADGRERLAIRRGPGRYRVLDPAAVAEGSLMLSDYPQEARVILERAGYRLRYEPPAER